ncbi:MAG: FecR domain-containing protein [Candidatus Peregrinibacteria bacterium]
MYEKLENKLKALNKPSLSQDRKRLMRARLVEMCYKRGEAMSFDVSREVVLSEEKKELMKWRIMAFIRERVQKRFYVSNFFAFNKKLVGAFVLFLMVFSMFGFLNIQTGVVMAESFSILDGVSGDVRLFRDGEEKSVTDGMRVYDKDKFVTGDDGFVSVRFFDDSMSRLSADGELVINKMYRPNGDKVRSFVEVSLKRGALWTRVVNLVEDSSFVVEAGGVYTSAKRAAFNVEFVGDEVEVGVYNHLVEIYTPDKVEKIVSGQKIQYGFRRSSSIDVIHENEKNLGWVKENLDNDKAYLLDVEEKLLTAKMKSVGVEVGENFNFEKSLREEVVLLLTVDDVKKKKIELDIAEENFVAAGVKLGEEDLTEEQKVEAEKALQEFSTEVQDFYKLVEEVSYTDEEYALELEAYVKDKVLQQKKIFGLVGPLTPSYEVKGIIEELELLGASDEEVVVLKEKQAMEKLSEAELFIEIGDMESAGVAIEKYKKDLGDGDAAEVVDVYGELKSELDKISTKPVKPVEVIVNKPVIVDIEPVEEVYGVKVNGDKPLDPLLNVD